MSCEKHMNMATVGTAEDFCSFCLRAQVAALKAQLAERKSDIVYSDVSVLDSGPAETFINKEFYDKLKAENERLKADRSAFATETQHYRDAWMNDKKSIAVLKTENEKLRTGVVDGISGLKAMMELRQAKAENEKLRGMWDLITQQGRADSIKMATLETENYNLRAALELCYCHQPKTWGTE